MKKTISKIKSLWLNPSWKKNLFTKVKFSHTLYCFLLSERRWSDNWPQSLWTTLRDSPESGQPTIYDYRSFGCFGRSLSNKNVFPEGIFCSQTHPRFVSLAQTLPLMVKTIVKKELQWQIWARDSLTATTSRTISSRFPDFRI